MWKVAQPPIVVCSVKGNSGSHQEGPGFFHLLARMFYLRRRCARCDERIVKVDEFRFGETRTYLCLLVMMAVFVWHGRLCSMRLEIFYVCDLFRVIPTYVDCSLMAWWPYSKARCSNWQQIKERQTCRRLWLCKGWKISGLKEVRDTRQCSPLGLSAALPCRLFSRAIHIYAHESRLART